MPKNLEKSVGRAAHIPRRYRIDYRTKIAEVLRLRGSDWVGRGPYHSIILEISTDLLHTACSAGAC